MNEITTDKLVADVKILIDDTEALIKATAGQAGERVTELRERMERKLADGRAALADYETQLRDQAEQMKASAITCWSDEECRRLIIAMGFGLLLGLALRLRR